MSETLKPMKAHKYTPARVKRPTLLQPKLNGLRCIWNGTCFNSYNEETWHPDVLDHITQSMHSFNLTSHRLDGELYVHGRSLQWINSRASINRKEPHAESHFIEFHVFDIATPDVMEVRTQMLRLLLSDLSNSPIPIKLCPTYSCNSEHEENVTFKLCRKEGYEGMIYRDPEEGYGFVEDCGNKDNRWWKMMKRKFWEDVDAVVLHCYEGKDGFAGTLGGFHCMGEHGVEFNVGGGEALTHEMRRQYWIRRDEMVGKTLKVKYEMLSDSGVPLKPVVEAVYE